MKSEYLTPQEVAGKFGVSAKTIYRAIQNGSLKCHRINGRVFRIIETDAALWWLMSTTGTTPNCKTTNLTVRFKP